MKTLLTKLLMLVLGAVIFTGLSGQMVYAAETDRIVEINDEEKEPMSIKQFTDIRESDWYYEAVSYVFDNKIMTGLNAATFGPLDILPRAQFAVILYRLNESPNMTYTDLFADVEKGQWYTDAILWAAENKIVTGYTATGTFGPADNIQRQQLAVMLYRYADFMGYDTSTRADVTIFTDCAEVDDYAKEAVSWAVSRGIITGKDSETRLDPAGNTTRAEAATMIRRFMEMPAEPENQTKIFTVGTNAMYQSIKEAYDAAKEVGTMEERALVLIYPGTYAETLDVRDNHTVDFKGYGKDVSIIKAEGEYPVCVLYGTGDCSFEGLTFYNTSNEYYAVHFETMDSDVTGTVTFTNCELNGATGIGLGLGANNTVNLIGCDLIGRVNVGLYAHNSPHSDSQDQYLNVINCYIKGVREDVLIDDTCFSYGSQNSVLILNFNGSIGAGGAMMFRKNTIDPSSHLAYIPADDENIKLAETSVNTNILGLNFDAPIR